MTTTKTSLLALTAAFLAHSTPVQASDILTDPSSAYVQDNTAAPHSWTGLWLGAVGGMSFFNSKVDYTDDDYDPDGDGGYVFNKNEGFASIDGLGAQGLFGEVQAGFDKQIGQRTVVGVFGGFNLSDAEFTAKAGEGDDTYASVAADYEWGSVLGARVGLLKSQSTLFYVAGGWAHAELGDVTGTAGEAFSLDGPTLDGYFGEIGMETQVADNVYLTVAGRYTDYGSETLWSRDGRVDDGDHNVESIEIDSDNLAVMVGLKAKLGGVGF